MSHDVKCSLGHGPAHVAFFANPPTVLRASVVNGDKDMHLCRQGASFGFFHDMLVTPNYYVLVENPITLDLQKLLTRYMFGRACLAECLEFRRDRRTRVHLLRRPGRQGAFRGF